MDVKQEINQKAYIFTLPHSFFYCCLIWSLRKDDYKSHPGARGRYRHNGLRMNTCEDVTYITHQHMHGLICFAQTDLQKFKGLLIKIKVIKVFSAKLKVLKDCNQIKGF